MNYPKNNVKICRVINLSLHIDDQMNELQKLLDEAWRITNVQNSDDGIITYYILTREL